jgi:3-methyladenine DNA glycosylase/8-oxoguanine DNA glycosylase
MAASGSPPTPDARLEWRADYRVDLRAVLGSFARGRKDPCLHFTDDGTAWRTSRTPDGPASLALSIDGDLVTAAAWGPGAEWLIESVPDLLGAGDDPTGFPEGPLPPELRRVWERYRSRWRTPRSRRVIEALVAAVLEQKVTGVQSRRAWSQLLATAGDPAPGPAPAHLRVFPAAETLRRVPSWRWHRWGATPHQSATIMRALAAAGRLEQCADLPLVEARRRLASLDGIGPWTVAEVGQRAMGDADAVSVGDFHLAHHVVFAFTGRTDGTDEQMTELLEPFAGHRYRVQRIVELSGIARPARGPRLPIADHRAH